MRKGGEKEMKTIKWKKSIEIFLILSFLIYVCFLMNVSEAPGTSMERYSKGWKFLYHGQGKLIDLPCSENVEAGDSYEISHKVSWELPSNCRLLFRSLQQNVEVYIDEKLVYEYPSGAVGK